MSFKEFLSETTHITLTDQKLDNAGVLYSFILLMHLTLTCFSHFYAFASYFLQVFPVACHTRYLFLLFVGNSHPIQRELQSKQR